MRIKFGDVTGYNFDFEGTPQELTDLFGDSDALDVLRNRIMGFNGDEYLEKTNQVNNDSKACCDCVGETGSKFPDFGGDYPIEPNDTMTGGQGKVPDLNTKIGENTIYDGQDAMKSDFHEEDAIHTNFNMDNKWNQWVTEGMNLLNDSWENMANDEVATELAKYIDGGEMKEDMTEMMDEEITLSILVNKLIIGMSETLPTDRDGAPDVRKYITLLDVMNQRMGEELERRMLGRQALADRREQLVRDLTNPPRGFYVVLISNLFE